MASNALTESVVEDAALVWLGSAGWQVRYGDEIAPGKLRVKEAECAIKETMV